MRRPAPDATLWPAAWAARLAMAAGLAAVLVGGCACERPKRVVFEGHEVPLVRVRLGEDGPSLAVAAAGPWRLDGPAGKAAAGPDLPWTDVALRGGRIVLGNVSAVGPLELSAERAGALWVRQTVGGVVRERCYRGVLRLLATPEGALRAVNVLPMEEYLAGVLANELPRSWHLEAFKAQAVAARTFALAERNQRGRFDFDVYDSTLSQVYGGAGTEAPVSWDAVRATVGVVATCGGPGGKRTLLKTYYHSTCGGGTVAATSVFGGPAPAPLAGGVPCHYCRRSPKYVWPDIVVTKQDLSAVLRARGSPELVRLGPIQRAEVVATTGPDGRAELIRLTDAAGASATLRANAFRGFLGAGRVPSTWFTIVDQGDRIVLTGGRGYGHGVGLCQWGAQYLAQHGLTGEQILRYYYPGVVLAKAY